MSIVPTPIQRSLFAPTPMTFDWDDRAVEHAVVIAFHTGVQTRYSRYSDPGGNWYNGASPSLRTEGGERIRAAVRMGLMPAPMECSVCRDKPGKRLHSHSENYWRPLACRPICPRCHRALHTRFNNPQPWLNLVARHAFPGAWFEHILMRELTDKECIVLSKKDNPIDPRQLDEGFVAVRSRHRLQRVATY